MKHADKTMKKRLYAAYGSNLSEEQMAYRCPDARIVGKAEVKDYRLMYKGSLTGAYATIEPEEGFMVPVLIWSISGQDEKNLDRYEGFPRFYYKKEIPMDITGLTGEDLGEYKVMAYIMDERRKHGLPSQMYESILQEGYERFGFDPNILEEAYYYTAHKAFPKKQA